MDMGHGHQPVSERAGGRRTATSELPEAVGGGGRGNIPFGAGGRTEDDGGRGSGWAGVTA